MSSKATRSMSDPIRRPRRRSAPSAPTAIGLSAASSAVGGRSPDSSRSAAVEPLAERKSPEVISSGSPSRPCRATARTKASCLARPVEMDRGPPM